MWQVSEIFQLQLKGRAIFSLLLGLSLYQKNACLRGRTCMILADLQGSQEDWTEG